MFLFKIWIFNIDFSTVVSFLIGILIGAVIICMIYALIVLSSLRNKKFLIKVEDDSLTSTEVKDMIVQAQKSFKDKDLRGELSRVNHCKNISMDLVYGIASRFFPKSKHPLLEISIDEVMMLSLYVKTRIEDILNRRGIRLLKKIKIGQIFDVTQKTTKVVNSKAFKVTKDVNNTFNTIKKIVNVVNPAWWVRKLIIDNTINVITDKLCVVIIAIVGEETYKIYSKTVFNQDVEIESNVDDIINSMNNDILKANDDIINSNDNSDNLNSDFSIPVKNDEKMFKTRTLKLEKHIDYISIFNPNYPMLLHDEEKKVELN
ncbi:MAG: hypothetical protein MR357_05995 [Anaeroplasma sp.]|nr:hypothetical protein [Anaeroplasma sp.]